MNVLSICSGIGGGDLGFKGAGFRTICYVEWEPFPQAVLLDRMECGELDAAPIWPDLRTFDARPWGGVVDCILAGIPCQPHSKAGKRAGKEDSRNLWPDLQRVIRELGHPPAVIIENVEGLYSGEGAYGPEITAELHAMGYVVVIGYCSAAQVGAPHERMRTFTIGFKHSNTQCDGFSQHPESKVVYAQESNKGGESSPVCSNVPLSHDIGCQESGQSLHEKEAHPSTGKCGWWQTEPDLGRVVDGISPGMDRYLWECQIKALGNAIVPQVSQEIGEFVQAVLGGAK